MKSIRLARLTFVSLSGGLHRTWLLCAALCPLFLLAGAEAAAADIQVTTTADAGVGSLRAAVATAAANPGVDTIIFTGSAFAQAAEIKLSSGELLINSSLSLTGPGANLLSISGNDLSRVFNIQSGNTVAITAVAVRHGKSAVNQDGGGISNSGNLSLSNCSISDNVASGLGGGGGVASVAGALTVNDCAISSNTAYYGAGVYVDHTVLSISRSSVSNNNASFEGGGMRIDNSSGSVSNSTVSGNQGGGIELLAEGAATAANLQLRNNTSAYNVGFGLAVLADGVAATSAVTLRSNLIANNTSANLSSGVINGGAAGISSQGYNLSSDDGGGFLNQASDKIDANAGLAPLTNNGGLTLTHALLSGSAALDAGISSGASTDQRGTARIFEIADLNNAAGGDGSDIGAFEAQALIVRNANDAGTGSLRQALSNAHANGSGVDDILFDSVFFNSARTITLSSGELLLNSSLSLNGPGANLLSVSGNDLSRVFNVSGANTVAISGISVRHGKSALNAEGGGIFSDGASLSLSSCVIAENVAVGTGAGGGIFSRFGSLSIDHCNISANSSNQGGGVFAGSKLAMTGSSLSGNSARAGEGGGLYVLAVNAEIANSTISNNSAGSASGGGIFFQSYEGKFVLQLSNSTLANNTGSGGVVVRAATGTTVIGVQLRSTLLAGNSSPNLKTEGVAGAATMTSRGFNLSTDNGSGLLNQATDKINANAGLAPLANNSGLTLTHALLSGSAALDAGNSFAAVTDQRGSSRSFDIASLANAADGDGSDIGAFEAHAQIVSNANDAGAGSLRQAISSAQGNGSGVDDIIFDSAFFNTSRTITLSSGELTINSSLSLTGPGANLLSISGNDLSRVVNISTGNTVAMSGIAVRHGKSPMNEPGGGIYSNGANLSLSACVVTDNAATGAGAGGGVYILGAALSIDQSTFSGNSANGGGAIASDISTVDIYRSTLNGNSARFDGGALNLVGANANIVSSTISTNSGGGLIFQGFSGSAVLQLSNSTVANNTGSGGIISRGVGATTAVRTQLRNTLVANNSAPNFKVDGDLDAAFLISQGFNLSSDNGGGFLNQGTDKLNANAMLAPLANNGGLTLTHALLLGSAALDAGNSFGASSDQRGTARIFDIATLTNAAGGDGSDIGAYESAPPSAPTIGAATPGNGQASFAFSAPANSGGSAIAAYTVSCNPGGISATGNSSPILLTGLTNGVIYSCSVRASNSVDAGPGSASVNVIASASSNADISISKSNGTNFVSGGMPGIYTLVVTNPGPAGAAGVRVTDTLAAAFSAASWNCSGQNGAQCPASGTGNIDALADMPAGSSVTFLLTTTVAALPETPVSNIASVMPPSFIADANLANNVASDGPDIVGIVRNGFE